MNFLCIHNNDVVAEIKVWGKCRLMFAPKDARHSRC